MNFSSRNFLCFSLKVFAFFVVLRAHHSSSFARESANGATVAAEPVMPLFILSSPPQSLLLYIIFAVSRRDSLSGWNFIFHRLHDLPLSHIVYRHECNPRLDRRIISVNWFSNLLHPSRHSHLHHSRTQHLMFWEVSSLTS